MFSLAKSSVSRFVVRQLSTNCRKLGAFLLQAGIITQKELYEGLKLSRVRNAPLWEVILDEKLVSEESLAETIAQWLKLPHVRIASTTVEPEAIKTISQELARKHLFDERVLPDCGEDFVFQDKRARALNQQKQHGKRLGGQVNDIFAAAKTSFRPIKDIRTERVRLGFTFHEKPKILVP